jgi:octaprenyl-diphosphate synthase
MSDLFAKLGPLAARVNRTLLETLEADKGLFGEVGVYSLLGGGKRLRPLIYCLAHGALGGIVDGDALRMSSSFELLHMATLIHDDIIDQSDTRRGRPSAHRVFGIPEAVLAADYLVAKAALMSLSKTGQATTVLMVELLRELTLGELAELKAKSRADLDRSEYLEIIYRKTAVLFETVGKAAAVLRGSEEAAAGAIARYGRCLGLAFQIVDDVLDYRDAPAALGKPVGQDLAEGRITLPFIAARENLAGDELRRLLELGGAEDLAPEDIPEARALVVRGHGPELALAEAERYAGEAVEALKLLPPSPERDLLGEVAVYAVERDR